MPIKSNENKELTTIENHFSKLRDGTDISYIKNEKARQALIPLTEFDILLWEAAKEINHQCEYCDINYGGYEVISEGYLFPDVESNRFIGYIINVTFKKINYNDILYIDIVIGDVVRTVKCELSKSNNIINRGIVNKFGSIFKYEYLLFQPVLIMVDNKKDSNNETFFTEIKQFHFVSEVYIQNLKLISEHIKGKELQEK